MSIQPTAAIAIPAQQRRRCVLAGNISLKNRHSDFKFMHGPQQADCTNLASGLGTHGTFHFGKGVTSFVSCPTSLPQDLARYVAFHRGR